MAGDERRVPAGEFKATCLRLMEEVRRGGRPIVITKRGRPVAKLVPVDGAPPPLFGRLKGRATARDDLIEPTGEVWEAMTGRTWDGDDG